MTTEEIAKMPAGPDMDLLVAVFMGDDLAELPGHDWCEEDVGADDHPCVPCRRCYCLRFTCHDGYCRHDAPPATCKTSARCYSRSAISVWKLIEGMARRGYCWSICGWADSTGPIVCEFWNHPNRTFDGTGPTIGEAVCRAALAVATAEGSL